MSIWLALAFAGVFALGGVAGAVLAVTLQLAAWRRKRRAARLVDRKAREVTSGPGRRVP